jgi:hypothetical protein
MPIGAVLALALVPASGRAAWLGFRNDLTTPVVIRTAVVVNGKTVSRGKPFRFYPGEVYLEAVLPPTTKTVTVHEAKKQGRLLYQGTVNCVGDQFYSVQPDSPGKVKLAPAKVPMRPPGRRPTTHP